MVWMHFHKYASDRRADIAIVEILHLLIRETLMKIGLDDDLREKNMEYCKHRDI